MEFIDMTCQALSHERKQNYPTRHDEQEHGQIWPNPAETQTKLAKTRTNVDKVSRPFSTWQRNSQECQAPVFA